MKDILAIIQNAIYEGDAQSAKEITETALKIGYSTDAIIKQALFPPMKEMGEKLKNGEIFIPEVLMSSRAMHASMYALSPIISHHKGMQKGVVVVGTVAGDLHDIGKNLIAMILRGSGFTVIDLGIDVTKEEFAKAIKPYRPDILAMSALLTTTMCELKNVIDYLSDKGIRSPVKIMVGGAPVTFDYAREIKADVFTNDMFQAVEAAEDLINHEVGKYSVS
jgi:5-methyltetrahydrofolate--homocysteine methyltransferase